MARRRHTRRRRRRGFGILYKLLSVVVISAAIVAALILFFKVNTITVSGITQYSEEEIIAASGVKTGDNLFLLNKYEISDAIIEQLPYVSSVSINRKLPDGLLIEVTDSNQGGVIEQDGVFWVISSEGKILGKRAEHGSGARILGIALDEPQVGEAVRAPEEKARSLQVLLELLAALDEKGMLQGVTQIDFSDESAISMDYAERFVVKLPYHADFIYKLSQVSRTIEKLEEQGDVRSGTLNLLIDGQVNFIPL